MSTPTPPPENPPATGGNPTSPSHITAPAPESGTAGPGGAGRKNNWFKGLPDTVRLFCQLWLAILLLEIVHQVLNVVMSLLDPSALQATARESLSPEQLEQVPGSVVDGVAVASVVLMGLFALVIMGVLAWMMVLVRNRSKHAATARRLLLVFGFYFAFRILIIFMMSPGTSDVPVAFYAVDGSLQIIVGVAAVLSLILSFRPDTLKWTREVGGDGPGDAKESGRPPRSTRPDNQEK